MQNFNYNFSFVKAAEFYVSVVTVHVAVIKSFSKTYGLIIELDFHSHFTGLCEAPDGILNIAEVQYPRSHLQN